MHFFIALKFSTTHCTTVYVWVNSRSNMPMFCPKKSISQPRVVQNPPFLKQMMLTHYTLRSVLFRPNQTPHICRKMAKCAIFITFRGSQKKHTPKVRVNREKFNIDFLATNFFGSLYIYGGAHISPGDFKSHRDGHNHRHRHRHPGPADFSKMSKNSENNFFLLFS